LRAADEGPEMSDRAPAASAAQAVAAHPPLSVAITTIGVIAIAMVGSTISSQLVDLDIADVGGGFSVSADDASWIASIATMSEVVSIPIAAILVRALSLRWVAVYSASLYVVCACLSLLVSGEDRLIVLRAMQSYCSGTMSVLMFVSVVATLPPGFARNIGLALFAFASTAPTALNASAGAFVTERWGWQGLYYFDITWGLTFLVLAWRFLRPAPRAMRLSEIDWLGYVILAVGLAALIMFMKQGDRFFWLDNPIIRHAGFIAAIAIPLAIAITSSQRFDEFVMPTMLFFQVVPKVAIAPLFLVWFGVGAMPKILVAFLISFFPIVIDAAVGLRSMSSEMTDLARSMGASRSQIFTQFRLPTSLPYLFSGLKVAATLAIAGAVVGEFVGADKGLGYLLLVTNSNMETALMFATLVGLTFIGLVFFYSVEFLESLLIPWHVTHRIREESGTM